MPGRYHEIPARHAGFSWFCGWAPNGGFQRAQELGHALHLAEDRAFGKRGSSGHLPVS
jgi:hypothetical protein